MPGNNNVTITVSVNNNTAGGFNAVNNGLHGLQNQVNTTNGSVQRFWRDSNGRLRDAQGRFATAAQGIVGSLGTVADAAGNAAGAIGGGGGSAAGGGGLGGALGGVAAVIGASALPAIGALSPMLFGLAAAGGVVALAMGDIKEEAKTLKPQFESLQKAASKAIMPGVRSMFKDLKVAMKEVTPTVKVAGAAVSDFAKRAGEFAKSPAFQKALLQNVKLGSEWFKEFGDSIFKFTQSFLEFGAKSKPTLDALGGGLNDILSIGLPGMFKGLESGIKGSAEMFDGLFDALNKILPALGRFSGQFADTFGPVFGSAFRLIGDLASAVMDALTPALKELSPLTDSISGSMDQLGKFLTPLAEIVGKVLAQAVKMAIPLFKNLSDLFFIIAPLAKDLAGAIGGALFDALNDTFGLSGKAGTFNDKLKEFGNWVSNHRGEITEAFRLFSNAIIDTVTLGVSQLPNLLRAWKLVTMGILDGFDVILSGSELAFGWIPGIGDKLTAANEKFDTFKAGYSDMLDSAISKSEEFKAAAVPALEKNKLKLNISNFDRQIKIAKEKLKDPNLTKERRAKLNADIRRLTENKTKAQHQLNSLKDKTAKIKGNKKDFDTKAGSVSKKQFKDKSVKVKASSGSFWDTVSKIAGKVVASAVVNLVPGGSLLDKIGGIFAHGGIVGQAASGGPRSRLTLVGERGPELVDLAPGSRVRSNDDTRRLMSGGGGGGGGGQPLVIQLNIGDRQLGELVIDPLRKVVRSKGGNVQAVIGN